MKIKTITCHDVYNAGAGLQAYALSTYLSNLGHDVEIIDYKPDYLSKHYSFTRIDNRYNKPIIRELYLLAKFPHRLKAYFSKRKKNYDNFKKNYLKVTSKQYISNDDLKNSLPQADIYIAGSDQIWNPNFPNGKDPAFYLNFVPDDKIKASYAASFSIDRIPDELKETIKNHIHRLDYVSVREKSGLNILNSMDITDTYLVLDPVFLLSKSHWESITDSTVSKDKYVLVYDFDKSDVVKNVAEKIAKNKGIKIYSIFDNTYADKTFQYGGPLDFISLIKNAEYIVSNSFHATAFSIIFEKQLFVINRKENLNSRMYDLTKSLGIENRLITDENDIDFNSTINYLLVNKHLSEQIFNSKAYIDMILSGAKTYDRQN